MVKNALVALGGGTIAQLLVNRLNQIGGDFEYTRCLQLSVGIFPC